jgi:hypothetical protein
MVRYRVVREEGDLLCRYEQRLSVLMDVQLAELAFGSMDQYLYIAGSLANVEENEEEDIP